MPKIFLIKNRLHQQQLRLLEAQHVGKSPSPCSGKESPLGSSEPLSLIVNKHQCVTDCSHARPPLRFGSMNPNSYGNLIQYSGIRIGPVVKKDVMKASIMLEHDSQYATILAFDVKIERDAQELADSLGVKIFQADIIYHLFDKFTSYREELKQRKRDENKHIAVFPCKLRVLPQYIFNSRDPIVMGVMVEAGIIKEGTPLCVPSKDAMIYGRKEARRRFHEKYRQTGRPKDGMWLARSCKTRNERIGKVSRSWHTHWQTWRSERASKQTSEREHARREPEVYFRDPHRFRKLYSLYEARPPLLTPTPTPIPTPTPTPTSIATISA
ncbi:hypothetical protein HZH68_005707 [Vespula germanica]|uniref:Translation initiation factor IF- 2 domain-containing protein n=1 Tax=Vespula germanica TaxID=30212 RepID=A0A834NG94_VESGE|nr:hypothetical protein HZH68_005707 [Vespula germanica]